MSRDPFMRAMSAFEPDEARCTRLAARIDRAMDGHPAGERMMVLCFHLNRILEDANECPRARASILAGMMRLIDPPKGSG